MNLLRIVDNPRQDIPLAAVLKSMIGGFTDVELAKIKSAYPDVKFHEACRKYAEEGKADRAETDEDKSEFVNLERETIEENHLIKVSSSIEEQETVTEKIGIAEKKEKENVKKQDVKGKDAECTIEVQIQEKLQTFFHNLRIYRQRAEFLPIHELIEELLETTGYGDYLAAEPAGDPAGGQCADAH